MANQKDDVAIGVNKKRCTQCNEIKSKDEFYDNKGFSLGKDSHCQICRRMVTRNNDERIKNSPYLLEKRKKYFRDYYQKQKDHANI